MQMIQEREGKRERGGEGGREGERSNTRREKISAAIKILRSFHLDANAEQENY